MMSNDVEEIVFLNPFTCGIYKDGGIRYKSDPITGNRTPEIDNELGDHVEELLHGGSPPGLVRVGVEEAFSSGVMVPRYYDTRWLDEFRELMVQQHLEPVSLGELEDAGILALRGGHGSPSSDRRSGNIPYIKVSDIRSLRVNINPTNLVSTAVASAFWRGTQSGLQAWDLITPNRASSNIGEFAVLLPGEERIVITKEVFVIRVIGGRDRGWDPFYLLWALCLRAVRKQWQRVALMQTNREDVGNRYKEILLPMPRDPEWASQVSSPFRAYFTTIAQARETFLEALSRTGYSYIASAHSVGSVTVADDEQEDNTTDDETLG